MAKESTPVRATSLHENGLELEIGDAKPICLSWCDVKKLAAVLKHFLETRR